MKKTINVSLLLTVLTILSISPTINASDKGMIYRITHFSNEFNVKTPEAINARGYAEIRSRYSRHYVKIRARGLTPGDTYVILNHWFEPIPQRGVPNSDDGPEDDPSCTGHFQFIGKPVKADSKGRIRINARVNQLAPHIWVANFAKFLQVTGNGTHAPSSPDAFTTGGLLNVYADIVAAESDFVDTDPLTVCDFD